MRPGQGPPGVQGDVFMLTRARGFRLIAFQAGIAVQDRALTDSINTRKSHTG